MVLSHDESTPVLTDALSVHYRGPVAPQETASDDEADGAEEQEQKTKSRGAARSKKARNSAASAAPPPRPMEPHGLGEVFFPARSGGGSLRGTFSHGEMLSGTGRASSAATRFLDVAFSPSPPCPCPAWAVDQTRRGLLRACHARRCPACDYDERATWMDRIAQSDAESRSEGCA